MRSFLAEDFRVFMVVGWDDLVPGTNGLVGGLFRELLCHSGFCDASRVNLCDAEVQFLSGVEERLVSYRGPHSGHPYGAHWFPRCHSFGVDDD